jgi:hypothetical protein
LLDLFYDGRVDTPLGDKLGPAPVHFSQESFSCLINKGNSAYHDSNEPIDVNDFLPGVFQDLNPSTRKPPFEHKYCACLVRFCWLLLTPVSFPGHGYAVRNCHAKSARTPNALKRQGIAQG